MGVQMRCVSGSPEALEFVLAAEVAAVREPDPLVPLAVLLGGTLMRPYLQRRLAEITGGIANVHFVMPSELALKLGEGAMQAEGRMPLPPLADRILLREVASAHEGYFGPVRETPGLADALYRLTRELRGSSFDADSFGKAIKGTCEVPQKEKALAAIFADFLDRRLRFYGPDDCLLAADPESCPWERLWVYGLWEASPALRECLERLSERIPVTVMLPETGSGADLAVTDLREWLVDRGIEPEVPEVESESSRSGLSDARRQLFARGAEKNDLDGTLTLLSGPDPQREVREVARTCLAWAREGVRFHEMAIAYRHPEPYRSLIELVFREAEIPLYLHEGTPISERPLGRQAIALLELAAAEPADGEGPPLERRTIMDLLAESRLPEETRERYGGAPVTRWDGISREAGVIAGLGQWRDRLEAYAVEREGSDREWEQKRADSARDLARFIADLDQALQAMTESASWSEQFAALRGLFETYIADPAPLLDPLEGLGRFDALGSEISRRRFAEFVIGGIENLRSDDVLGGRPGAFGRRGVNVLDVNSLRHLRFRAVAVVGLADRSFPPPPRPDPLLLDDEREALNARHPQPLPLRVRRPDPEPLQFALATWAAREQLLVSYPRRGTDGGAQLPSYFLRSLARAATGEPVGAEDLDSLPSELLRRVSGGRIGAGDPERSLSRSEFDRTLIEDEPALGRAVLAELEPRVERGFEARSSRQTKRLTPFDGSISPEVAPLLAELQDPERVLSPSGLERYAECPQRYFLGSVLRVNRPEEPEELVRINPLERGSLIHCIFQRFLSEGPSRKGEELLSGRHEEERLLRIAGQECDRVEKEGLTGFPLLWSYDRAELLEDMRRWLTVERAEDWVAELPNGDYEVRFGPSWWAEADEGKLSRDKPLEIMADGVKLRVGGKIDRLNWSEDRFRVVDYKTGSTWGTPDDGGLDGGESLQLPLYLWAAAEILGMKPEQGSAEYHYATRRGEFDRSTFSGEAAGERREEIEEILGLIAAGLRDGDFQMGKRDLWGCQYCDYDHLCPTDREGLMERKGGDARARPLAQMRKIE